MTSQLPVSLSGHTDFWTLSRTARAPWSGTQTEPHDAQSSASAGAERHGMISPLAATRFSTIEGPIHRSTLEDPVRAAEIARDAIVTLKQELDIAKRLLEAVGTDRSASSALGGYAERLREVLSPGIVVDSATGPALLTLSLHLVFARDWLLDAETNYPVWSRFARVLFPTGSITVPKRFVRPARPPVEDEPINLRVVDMALRLAGER